MLLKSLELHGFKTFPDKTKLSFGKGITAVVGPNGSGKSNISDAIRWVLGEQSIKTLRCSKMEDVIFGGTPFRKAQGFAEVTLTIDNKDRKLPFDGDEVAVSRRYYRSGESEYLINKAAVRLKDIHELFMDTGLGRDGYSMISQGKIDSIVASKSEDRREIFEEAAGISRYRYRKLEAERKLKQAEENLVRLRDILSELEDRVGPLKEQAEKAREYLKLTDEKRALEIGIWLNSLNKFSKDIRDQNAKIAISNNQHEDIERELERLKNEADSIFEKTNFFTAKTDEIRRQISVSEESAALRLSRVSVLENDIEHNHQNVLRVQSEIDSIKNSSIDIDLRIEKKNLEIAEKKEQIEYKEEELEKTVSALSLLKDNMATFSDTIDSLSKQLSDMSLKLSNMKVQSLTSTSTIAELETRIASVNSNIDTYSIRIDELNKDYKDFQQMSEEAEIRVQELNNTVSGYEFKLKNKKQKLEELKRNADKLSLDAEEKIRRIRLLEELERNLEGFTQSVKLVMRESKNGSLFGIHGPVSRLIKVPNRYAVAIETALGAAMQNIVVENENDAKRAIALLKHRDAGRATFLPISTIRGRKIEEVGLNDCYGFVGIASDMCDCDSKYTAVLESLLGRIVIADDLDCATKIAKKFGHRFRVVTLDGQVVNVGGSLTGGSLARNSGLLSRASEIERLRRDSQELKVLANKARISYKESETECSNIEAKLMGVRGDLSRAQEDKIRISSECRNCKNEVDSYNNMLTQNLKESDILKKRIEELKITKINAENEYNTLKTNISNIEEEISSVTGDRKNLSEKREKFTNEIQELKLLLVSYQKDIELIMSEIGSLERAKNDQARRIKELEDEILSLNKKETDILNDIEKNKMEADSFKSQVKQFEKQIEEINVERMSLEKYSVNIRQLEREKSIERENVGKELARLEEQKAAIQKEYDLIISKLWEEYELTRREAEENFKIPEDVSFAQKSLNEIRLKIKKLGSINIDAIEEYKEVSGRYDFLKGQLDDVEKSKLELSKMIVELTRQMRELFTDRFNKINSNFTQTFKELFGGGSAGLTMTDPQDVLNSGIEITVQPPGKIVSYLEALSGGEKALVAIALYFAIMKVSPAPFCVLDEIEAALDDVNVDRYAAYLRKMNDNTQFIVITHRRGTMEEADVLHGVTMQDEGISKLLELRASEIEKEILKR